MDTRRKFTFCRLCLCKGEVLMDIFQEDERLYTAAEVIINLLQLQVTEDDGYSKFVCLRCFDKLSEFKQFKEQCMESKDTFEKEFLPPLLRFSPCGGQNNHATCRSDGLPPTICEDCMRKLTDFKYFKKVCINSRIEFLICRINDGLVVPTGVDESGPLPEDLHCQGDLHARGSWSNVGAEGIKSEVTGVNSTDGVSVPVEGGGGREGNSEETLIRERGWNRLKGTGHQRSARKQHYEVVPVATHSYLKQRRLRSHSKNENCGPNEGIESTACSTSGKQFGERNAEHTKRREETRRGSKHCNVALDGDISIGSSVGDEKSEGQDFMWDECGRVFRSKDLIERHVKVPCGTALVECGIFSTKCRNRNVYKKHRTLNCGSNVSRRRVQRGVAVDMSGKSEDRRQINKRIPATCDICSKTFSRRSDLNVHVKTVHLKERNFSCGICGNAFGLKGSLQGHMRSHSGIKPYTCSHCQKRFTRSGHLRQHIRAVHEMEKPHACGECGKTFSQKAHLRRHILIHTGKRPDTCDICSKTFPHKHHLESHRLIHTGEFPHTCTLCSKKFRHNVSLKHHMATHARKVPHP